MANTDNRDILIAQYQYLEREVNYSKRQQMMVTYYALILYGAIIHTHNDWYVVFEKSVLLPTIASCTILVGAILFLCSCVKSQKQNNRRARKLRKHICQTFMISEHIMGAAGEGSVPVNWVYYLLHFIACIITVLIIVN